MSDKELADAVVALGVGRPKNLKHTFYCLPDDTVVPAESFVRHWQVAGALMEKWPNVSMWYMPVLGVWKYHVSTDVNEHDEPTGIVSNESLPRAIIEACVLALDSRGE